MRKIILFFVALILLVSLQKIVAEPNRETLSKLSASLKYEKIQQLKVEGRVDKAIDMAMDLMANYDLNDEYRDKFAAFMYLNALYCESPDRILQFLFSHMNEWDHLGETFNRAFAQTMNVQFCKNSNLNYETSIFLLLSVNFYDLYYEKFDLDQYIIAEKITPIIEHRNQWQIEEKIKSGDIETVRNLYVNAPTKDKDVIGTIIIINALEHGKYSLAEEIFLDAKNNYSWSKARLFAIYLNSGKLNDAERIYLINADTQSDIGRKLFDVYLEGGNLADAERIYSINTDKHSDMGRKLFDVYLEGGNLADAERIYRSKSEIYSENGARLFEKYLSQKKFPDAEQIYFDNFFKDAEMAQKLAEQYLIANQYRDALRVTRILPPVGRSLLFGFVARAYVYGHDTALDTLLILSESVLEAEHATDSPDAKLIDKISGFFKESGVINNANLSSDSQSLLYEQMLALYRDETEPVSLLKKIEMQNSKNPLRDISTANYYIALKFDMEGMRNIADQYYSQVVSANQNDMFEYHLARRALQNVTTLSLEIDGGLKTLAVTNFEANGFSEDEARIIANRVASLMTRMNRFTVLERNKMDEILKEQGFQLSGCTSDECIVEVGQLLGVQLILAGNIGRFGNLNIIELRIIDVGTGKIVKTASHELSGEPELLLTEGTSYILNELLR